MKLGITTVFGLGALLVSALNANATLVYIGSVSDSGQGHGAVLTSVTFQNTGTESGCVGTNTAGQSAGGTPTAYVGSAECPTATPPITGGDEKTGNGQSNVYTATKVGIQAMNINGYSFANLVVLFNGVQSQNSPSITLNNLALDLFSPTGTLLASYQLNPAFQNMTFNAFPGTGNAGFGFQLDMAEAAQAQAVLVAHPDLLIATAATASNANGGPDTISLTTIPSVQTPEPATLGLLGVSLGALAIARRKQKLS